MDFFLFSVFVSWLLLLGLLSAVQQLFPLVFPEAPAEYHLEGKLHIPGGMLKVLCHVWQL